MSEHVKVQIVTERWVALPANVSVATTWPLSFDGDNARPPEGCYWLGLKITATSDHEEEGRLLLSSSLRMILEALDVQV